MIWPFRKKPPEPGFQLLPSVTLTEEEQQECEAFLRSVIPQSDEGDWCMPREAAEVFQRGMVAACMMGRAERFAILRQYAQACEAASKACCIDPQCTHFFKFARILESAGKGPDAREMFAEGLRRYEADQSASSPDVAVRIQTDLEQIVTYARSKVAGR